MDTKQIEYILKIAEENNITHAAEKLYITQSALNQQLLKLEKELGTPLFNRSRANWSLTDAGRIYVEGAREIMKIKNTTYNRIYDICEGKKGSLTIGLAPGRGLTIFTEVYPKLHEDFPNLSVRPIEMRVRPQQDAIARGDIDIGLMTLHESDRTSDNYINVGSEEIMLAIPASHPLAKRAAAPGELPATIDLREFKDESFVLMDKDSTLRSMCDRLFGEAGIVPNVLFETNNTAGIVPMVASTICCGLIPWYYVKTPQPGVVCFALESHPKWDIAISYPKAGYLNSGAKEFIRLAKEFCEET